jgi:hypothetical protein
MPTLHVIVSFDKLSDANLILLATAVSADFYGNAAFPSLPATLPTKAVLDAANAAFGLATANPGGPAQTADKKNKRDALIALLRQLAAYVQANCNNDDATALSTGFQTAKPSHAPAPALASVPVIRKITNGATGQLIIKADPVDNSYGYKARYATVTGGTIGPWVDYIGNLTDSRAMILGGLTPATVYSIEICANLGGSRTSDWSVAMQHMCM